MINELEVFTQMELDKGGVTYELEYNAVVIGNIYDNPELLEVTK